MNIPLNPDSKDPVWTLFGKVIKLIDSRISSRNWLETGCKV